MLSETNNKNQDLFVEIDSELVHWINLRGAKNDGSAEKVGDEFLESSNSSHALLDEKKNLFRSFPFLFKARHRSDKGDLKDARLVFASEISHFSMHEDTSGLVNVKLSQNAHMII